MISGKATNNFGHTAELYLGNMALDYSDAQYREWTDRRSKWESEQYKSTGKCPDLGEFEEPQPVRAPHRPSPAMLARTNSTVSEQ